MTKKLIRKDKILITGSTGFIGKNLFQALKYNYDILAPKKNELNLQNLSALKKYLNLNKPEFIIHLASSTINQYRESIDIKKLHYLNTFLTTMNLAKSINYKCKLVIFFGSIEEYGLSKLPFSERNKPKPISDYGKAKLNALKEIEPIMKNKKIRYTWLRPSLTYGFFDQKERYLGHIIQCIKKEKKIVIKPGNQIRDFLYIEDLIKVLKLILINYKKRIGILNISPASKILIKEIPFIISKILNKNFNIIIKEKNNREYDLYMSNKKLLKIFPEFKFVSLKEGLKKTLKMHKLK